MATTKAREGGEKRNGILEKEIVIKAVRGGRRRKDKKKKKVKKKTNMRDSNSCASYPDAALTEDGRHCARDITETKSGGVKDSTTYCDIRTRRSNRTGSKSKSHALQTKIIRSRDGRPGSGTLYKLERYPREKSKEHTRHLLRYR